MFKLNWTNGPKSDRELLPGHGRPIICLDINQSIIVTGSSDHGLRVYDTTTGKQTKELYSKKYGHTEWVTSCTIVDDGRVLSGGLDSKICVWEKAGVKCNDLTGHKASISKVMVDHSNIAISSSYDTGLLLWNINKSGACAGLFGGHQAPIFDFDWHNSVCASGGKDGSFAIWDINNSSTIYKSMAHVGPVSKIKILDENYIASVGNSDGCLHIFDSRSMKPIEKKQIHGASINYIAFENGKVVTCSYDKSIKLFDIKMGKVSDVINVSSPILCGDNHEKYLALGLHDGNLISYDMTTLKCLFGYGASQSSINAVKISPDGDMIAVGGESGVGLLMSM